MPYLELFFEKLLKGSCHCLEAHGYPSVYQQKHMASDMYTNRFRPPGGPRPAKRARLALGESTILGPMVPSISKREC